MSDRFEYHLNPKCFKLISIFADMEKNKKQLEKGATKYAQEEISDLAIGAKYVGSLGGTSYFEPQYRPSLVSSTGNIHLITHSNGRYGVTYDREEIESVSAELF